MQCHTFAERCVLMYLTSEERDLEAAVVSDYVVSHMQSIVISCAAPHITCLASQQHMSCYKLTSVSSKLLCTREQAENSIVASGQLICLSQ